MYFEIAEKPTTDCLSLYNNADLISKVSEEIASEKAENCRCRQPHCRLMPFTGNSRESINQSIIKTNLHTEVTSGLQKNMRISA